MFKGIRYDIIKGKICMSDTYIGMCTFYYTQVSFNNVVTNFFFLTFVGVLVVTP